MRPISFEDKDLMVKPTWNQWTPGAEISILEFLATASSHLLKDQRRSSSSSADHVEIKSNLAHAQHIFHWGKKNVVLKSEKQKRAESKSKRKKKEAKEDLTLEHFVACLRASRGMFFSKNFFFSSTKVAFFLSESFFSTEATSQHLINFCCCSTFFFFL